MGYVNQLGLLALSTNSSASSCMRLARGGEAGRRLARRLASADKPPGSASQSHPTDSETIRHIVPRVSDRTDRLEHAFAALNDGDASAFRELFAEHGQWLAIPGSGPDGTTPT